MNLWLDGNTIIIRNIARSDGTVTTAIPGIVIADQPDLLAIYIPKNTHYKNNWVVPPDQRVSAVTSTLPSAQRQYRDLVMRNDSLRLYLAGCGYSLGFTYDDAGNFVSWYGNLEAPYLRTRLGIDTRDFALDVVAYPDGRWQWKDEEEFNRRLEVGIDSPEHHAWVRAQGRDLIERFEQRTWPFNAGWERWRPSESWSPRSLPEDWSIDVGTHGLLMGQRNSINGIQIPP